MTTIDSFEIARRKLSLNKGQMAAELGVSPEWYSKIIQGKRPISTDLLLRLDDLIRRRAIEQRSNDTLKTGASSNRAVKIKDAGYGEPKARNPMVSESHTSNRTMVAPLEAPGRKPSTRTECAQYFNHLLHLAERSGDPNVFPVIFDRLRKKFPLDEFEADARHEKAD